MVGRATIAMLVLAMACRGDDASSAPSTTEGTLTGVGPGDGSGDGRDGGGSTVAADSTAGSSGAPGDASTSTASAGSDASGSGTDRGSSGGSESTGTAMEVSFFVTSQGNGAAGGNYGGLAGADARCQTLAEAAGLGERTWRAYLSQAAIDGAEVVHARDRIGQGPWRNAALEVIAEDLDSLHTVGLDPAMALDESGQPAGKGPPPGPEHDILTGSNPDGTLAGAGMTCQNWMSADQNDSVRVGHHDWSAIENPITTPQNFNSVHPSPCDAAGMAGVLGSGRLYCFAP